MNIEPIIDIEHLKSIGKLPQILTEKSTYTIDYPFAVEIAVKQLNATWSAEELNVKQCGAEIRSILTEAEREGLIEILRVFTEYELRLGGDDFWGGKIQRMFPRIADIQRAANMISCAEINMHAVFYNGVNEALNINTDAFYESWKGVDEIKQRIAYIAECAASTCPLLTTAGYAFIEGVALFSNFGYLKSFGVDGHHMLSPIVAGVDASAKDENMHSVFSAYLFGQTKSELEELGVLSDEQKERLRIAVYKMAQTVYDHELALIERVFAFGNPRTVSKEKLIYFVRDRINVVLDYLKYPPLFDQNEGEISGWFYSTLNTVKIPDFFHSTQIQYSRDWVESKLGVDKSQIKGEFPLVV